jgi:hypothetical protein
VSREAARAYDRTAHDIDPRSARTGYYLAAWLEDHKRHLREAAASTLPSERATHATNLPYVVHPEKLEKWLAEQALKRAKAGHPSNKHKVLRHD